MKQILDGYGYGIIQDCFGLLTFLEEKGFSKTEFLKFVEKSKTENIPITPKAKPKKHTKPIKNLFLKPGETEKMIGVKCEKCGGAIYIEGLCPVNPLFQKGFVRKGICENCGNEFGIK